VYEKPDTESAALGYLRAGARVRYALAPLPGAGCRAGFYAIEPRGYVCGEDVALDAEHILTEAFQGGPDRSSGLPYLYGRVRSAPPHLYNRVPTSLERQEREPGARPSLPAAWQPLLTAAPGFLLDNQPSLRFNGQRRSELAVSSGQAMPGSAFALLQLFETDSGAFGLSTDLSVIPLERLELVTASTFAGVPLSPERGLPLTFVQTRNVMLYSGDPRSGLSAARRAQFREAFPMTGRRERVGGVDYLETRSGQWLLDTRALLHIEPLAKLPHWAKQHRTWIDISIERQTLVAYEGEQPVYATLVSTGQAGAEDPENSRETVQGEFLIHTKHVTRTMKSDVPGDEYDLRDVPYVQYFSGGTALHAAFWHDDFGARKSHGCVNLSPVDARWLFDWSEPKVPQRWHGAMSALQGTLVSVHP
jgi:lipoprotein-anchoring transpeptidase ErfK/SrfK